MLEKTNDKQWLNSLIYGLKRLNPLRFKGIQAAYLFLFSLFFLPISAFAEDLKGTPAVTTIWVVGDKDLVADAFSACAMLFGNGGIMGALFLSSVIAIGTMACATIIHRSMNVFNYIVIFVVVMALFTVKTTVYIASYYDLDPKTGQVKGGVIGAVPHKEIANVPVGVALPLGIMSNFGKAITDKFDTALNSPNSEAGFLIQGSEGYFSPLKTILRLRNQWNTPENQYLMDNIRVVMDKETGCGWNQGNGAELLGKQGLRGLLANSTPSGIDKPIKIPEIDPITGNVLSVGTYTVDCPLAGLIINAQMLQNVSALQGKNYSQLAESIAKKRNLALTASGTKDSSDYTKRVAATQQEIDKVPNLVIKSLTGSYSGSTNVAITIQDTSQFLNQVRKMAETQNGTAKQAVSYQNAKNKGIIPSTMIIGNAITIDHINAAEIQANMIYGNLLLNCLSNDVTCARAETLMTDARSKAAVDSAGQASMYAHYMHYGMNILVFIYVVMSPLMIIVIMAMGVHGWKLIKSYLLFAVWINSWLPASIAIAYYQLRSYETSVANLVKSLIHEPAMIYSPVVVNNILSGAADSIASASNFMASVPLLMMALLSGSVYGLTHLAQKAAMSHKDYVDEGAVVQSPNDAQSYNGQIAQAMMRSTGGNATSANAEHLVLGTREDQTTKFALSASTQQVDTAKQSISDKISALENVTNTGTWTHADSYSEAVENGILIGTSQNGERAISFGQSGSHAVSQLDTSNASWALSLDANGNVASKAVGVGGSAGYSNSDAIGEKVEIVHQNGEVETLREGMQIARTDTIRGNFGEVTGEEFMQAQSQQLAHQKAQLSAIETAQSHSNGSEITTDLGHILGNQIVSDSNYFNAHNHALSQISEQYGNTEFAQRIGTGNMAHSIATLQKAFNSNDAQEFQAASTYMNTLLDETNFTGKELVSQQLDGYMATRNSEFEQQIHQRVASEISARNAESLGSFTDSSISQKGGEIRDNIESGKTAVGVEQGRIKFAKEHNGYSHEQVAQMRELNNQEIIQQAQSYMARLEDIHSNKMQQQDYGVSDEYFDGAKYLWNKEDASLLDRSVAVLGFAAGAFEWGLSKVPFANDMNKHLLVAADEDNWKETIAQSQQEGMSIKEMLDSHRFSEQVQQAKEHLNDKPLTQEIAEKVGTPKYAAVIGENADQSSVGEKSLGDRVEKVATDAIALATGSSTAHAGAMPNEYLQQTVGGSANSGEEIKTTPQTEQSLSSATPSVQPQKLYRSKNFTDEKAEIIKETAERLGVKPNDLAQVISFETVGSFSTNARNPYSSGTGLIQFMGKGKNHDTYYGMTRDQFGSLSFKEQMKYVEKYFKERGFSADKPRDIADLYTAVTGYGYKKGSREYELNKVWDANKNGVIEKGEMVQAKEFKAHKRKYFEE